MKILEYGTEVSANDVVKETLFNSGKHGAPWLNVTSEKFDVVMETPGKKKSAERQFKANPKYIDVMDGQREASAILHLFPKEERKQEQKPKPSTESKAPSLRDEASELAWDLGSKNKLPGLWMIDALIEAIREKAGVSGFARDLLLAVTPHSQQLLKTTDSSGTFLPVIGASWYVYIDHRLLKPRTKLALDTKYLNPRNMNALSRSQPDKECSYVGLRYTEILEGAGAPDAGLLTQLLANPCDITNGGLEYKTRLWFMVACLAESVRHAEWHVLARLGIELVGQKILSWRELVTEDFWPPQTDGAVEAMKQYKQGGSPRPCDNLYFDRCLRLLVTWMMSRHQAKAPTTPFKPWLEKNFKSELAQVVSGIPLKDWSGKPDLAKYQPRIVPPPAPQKPKSPMELFQERIELAKERPVMAVVLQTAVRGYLARMHLQQQLKERSAPPTK